MKRLLIAAIVLCVFFLCSFAIAGPGTPKPETKFQVVIEVTYNAVTAEEARKIYVRVLKDHEDACKVEEHTSKVSIVSNGGYIRFGNFTSRAE